MAVIQNPTESNILINQLSAFGIFACMSCLIIMLKFRGFKATLNFQTPKKQDSVNDVTLLSITGAYRINRDEFFVKDNNVEALKRQSPPISVFPPTERPQSSLRPAKSSNDITKQKNIPPNLNQSMQDISQDPRGGTSSNANRNTTIVVDETKQKKQSKEQKNIEKKKLDEQKNIEKKKLDEQKNIEKKKLDEQKARDKAAAKEQAKQEKLRKETEKKAAKEQAKLEKENKKKKQPAPKPQSLNPLAANPVPSYSTNTMQSSISKSSGPPPYTEEPSPNPNDASNTTNSSANPSNVSFGKSLKEESSSWDMISQHREQMNRPVAQSSTKGGQKNMVMDLQYKLGGNTNSDA